ncbi:hypothetical protein V8B97DRAFT_2004615, partial [Scleroderma yunnanense]
MANKDHNQHLQLEGKCFNCEGTDHIEHNCPKHWQTKDNQNNQQLLLNSVRMTAAEAQLAAIKEGTELGLFAVGSVCSEMPELQQAKQDLLKACTIATLNTA